MDLTLSAQAAGLVGVIMVLVSVSKTWVDSKWSPLVALGLSLLASFMLVPGPDVAHTVLQGILMSLVGSGLYAGGKVTAKAVTG